MGHRGATILLKTETTAWLCNKQRWFCVFDSVKGHPGSQPDALKIKIGHPAMCVSPEARRHLHTSPGAHDWQFKSYVSTASDE